MYSYVWWDTAVQAKTVINTHGMGIGYRQTVYGYDALGHLTTASIADDRPRTVTFVTDANGQVLQRDEEDGNTGTGDPRAVYYYFNGLRVGDISNNGTSDVDYATSIARHTTSSDPLAPFSNGYQQYADFDQSYDPINGLNYEGAASRYTVQDGDTLPSIAAQLWGDASLWYMIADANGLDGSETLAAGRSLIIPNKVHNVHNNSDTYRVYDPNEAIGNTLPTAVAAPKPPKKNKCGVFGQILLVAIAVAVAALSYGSLTAPATAIATGTTTVTVGTASAAFTTFSIGGGGLLAGGGLASLAAGAIAGAAGSIVSQGVGVATGLQNSFSWKGVALSALAGGITAGLGGVNAFESATKGLAAFGNAAVRGALSSALTQGIGVATGLQNQFDFAGVAAAGVAAGVGSAIGGSTPIGRAGSNMAAGIAAAAATSLVTGRDFGDTIMSQLPSIIGNTIGGLIADGISSVGAPRRSAANGSAVWGSTELLSSDARVTTVPAEQVSYLADSEIVVTADRETMRQYRAERARQDAISVERALPT